MPDWVQTNYVISGDAEHITEIHNALEQHKDSCDEVALSDLIEHFGSDVGAIECRGHIAEYTMLNPCNLEVKTLTAYYSMHGVWEFVRSKLSSVSYQFVEIG